MTGGASVFVSGGPGQRGLDAWGHFHVVPFLYSGPLQYVTGGEAITPQQIKLGTIEFILGSGAIINTDGTLALFYIYNRATAKIQAFWGNAGSVSGMPEVTSTTNIAAYIGTLVAFGKG